MTTLSTSATGEVYLTLRGPEENRILMALRRWPHWSRHEVERDPLDTERYLAITLVTSQTYEATLRDILRLSFGMTFPPDGGSSDIPPLPPTRVQRRRW